MELRWTSLNPTHVSVGCVAAGARGPARALIPLPFPSHPYKHRFTKPNHDVPATAETRAKNRACSDLLGIGDAKR